MTKTRMMIAAALAGGMGFGATLDAGLIKAEDSDVLGTWLYDFEAGFRTTSTDPANDFWWQIQTASERQLAVWHTNPSPGMYLVGMVDFNSITEADLVGYPYNRDPILSNLTPGATNDIPVGAVFAVRTTEGNFAKVQVTEYGIQNRLFFTYELYDGDVEPVACADFDDDGTVTFNDLNILLSQWNMPAGEDGAGDANGDGFVDFADLNLLLSLWDSAC